MSHINQVVKGVGWAVKHGEYKKCQHFVDLRQLVIEKEAIKLIKAIGSKITHKKRAITFLFQHSISVTKIKINIVC